MAIPLRPVDALVPPRTRILERVSAEALPLAVLAVYALAVARLLPYELLQDGWLTLVAGRELATNGLVRTDELTQWAAGAEWVDQQWLGQLAFYGATVVGGVKAALLAHYVVLVGTFAATLAAARSLGGRAPTVALVGALCMFMAPWTLQLRAQTLALPLFVATLWLLASDSRRPSRRVFLVVPIIVLWANIHGTVVLGAALVVLRGLTRRTLALVAIPPLCVFASPYAPDLVGYYRTMLLDSTLREFIVEWARTTPSAITALFFVVGAATVALLLKNGGRLTWFERGALVFTLAGGVLAIRSIVWFGLTAAILLPSLLGRERRGDDAAPRVALGIAVLSAAALAIAVGSAAAQSESSLLSRWPAQAAVATAELDRPVFADDRFANWLLWERPELRGRLAYDIRFELLERQQLERLAAYNAAPRGTWRHAIRGYDVLVVDVRAKRKLAALLESGFEARYRDERVAVLARSS